MFNLEDNMNENTDERALIALILTAQSCANALRRAKDAQEGPCDPVMAQELEKQLERARRAAWEFFVQHFSALIRQVVLRYLIKFRDFNKVQEHIDELVQDAMVRAFTALLAHDAPEGIENLGGWLRVTLLNITKQNITRLAKEKQRFRPIPVPGGDGASGSGGELPAPDDASISMSERVLIDVLDQPLMLRVLKECLDVLSLESRYVVLNHMKPMTFQQIAREVKRDTTWAWRTYQAALKLLQKCFRSKKALAP